MRCMRFFLILASLSMGSTAVEASRLKITPVKLVGYVGNDLQINYELPCGSEYYGLVASKDKKGRLRVAAAVSINDIVCTSLPEQKMIQVGFLATRGFRVISPMDVNQFSGRVVLVQVKELRLIKTKSKKRIRLQTVSETRCGQQVGAIIRQTSESKIEVGYLEHLVLGQKVGDCPKQQSVKVVEALKLTKGTKIGALLSSSADLSRQYRLRLAPIDVKSLTVNEGGSLSFKYKRMCAEAPIGHVVEQKNGKGRLIKLGMLVANYHNLKCPQGARPAEWMTYHTSDIFIPKGWSIATIKATALSETMMIKSPTEFAKTKNAKKRGIYVEYLNTCDLPLGVVYARSSNAAASDVLAVGILTRKATSQCKKKIAEVSLYQPFVSNRVRVTDMFPLRIKGMTNAH